MNERSVLVFGDDGSAEADVAWLWINCQRWDGWRLEVVEAVLPPPGPAIPVERSTLHPWSPSSPRRAFAESGLRECSYLTAEADPRVVLNRRADLVVVGPRGTGLLKSLHLGSTAEWLLAHPPSPLLVARHGREVRSVVVGADGSVHSKRAIQRLATLPWTAALDVTVVGVDDGRTDPAGATAWAAELLAGAGARVRPRIVYGRPAHELLIAVDQERADLVVLGTRGLTGLARLNLGSTAGAVARSAPCSVLVDCEPAD